MFTNWVREELTAENQTYLWDIEYILKNGEHVFAKYNGTEKDGEKVMNSLLIEVVYVSETEILQH